MTKATKGLKELPDCDGIWKHDDGNWLLVVRTVETAFAKSTLAWTGFKGDYFTCGFLAMLPDDFPRGNWHLQKCGAASVDESASAS